VVIEGIKGEPGRARNADTGSNHLRERTANMANATPKRFQCPDHWSLGKRLTYYTDRSGGPDACWPWTGHKTPRGYGGLQWKGKPWRAHRLAWIEANGPIPPDKPHILHDCDHPPCCNPAHLFCDTHAANMADKMRKGRAPHGETNVIAKLTEADVRAIRAAAGTHRDIAKRFGIDHTHVGDIKRRERWRHLL
jgi:hypothetical protein